MALKDIFTMIKADKYTADGREELIKAQEVEIEDRTYQIGEISQKTGLQKTANGWVKPKSGKQAGAKKEENHPAAGATNGDKWQKNTDYLGRERISMETPQGGKVSIYESDNPKQKNARFRVDTGSHYNEFNTMEEAKAFAEEHYGVKNDPKLAKEIANMNHFEESKKAAQKTKREEATKADRREGEANAEAYRKATNEKALNEWTESAKKDAKAYNENMVVMQHPGGQTTAVREGSPDVEKAEAKGYKKMSLVRPDGSVKKHSENNPAESALEGINEQLNKTGDVTKNSSESNTESNPADFTKYKRDTNLSLYGKSAEEGEQYMKENGFNLVRNDPDYKVYKNDFGEEYTVNYTKEGKYNGGSHTPAPIPGLDNHKDYQKGKGNKYLGTKKHKDGGTTQVYLTPEGKYETSDFNSKGEYSGGSTSSKEFYKKWYDYDLEDSAPRVLTGDCKVRIRKA